MGGEQTGKRPPARGEDVSRDIVSATGQVAGGVLSAVHTGVDAGFQVGKFFAAGAKYAAAAGAAAAASLAVTGHVSQTTVAVAVGLAASIRVAELGIGAAHSVTSGGFSFGKTLVEKSSELADQLLDAYGVPNGVVVRLIFGEDTGEALLFVQAIAAEIGGLPPPGMSPLQLVESINALNWLHCQADVHSLDTSAPATALGLVGARRYLPFALCTYGHLGLKFLGLVPLSGAAWQSDLACVDSLTGGARVLRSDWNGSLYRPGHVLMVDDRSRAVVLAFRGTLALHDALTDLVCHPLPLDGGRAHGGMLEAAQRVLEELRPDLVATLDGHPGYDLVLTGHSLGAGLASLIATLLGPSMALTTGDASVRCFAFAPPAVLSLQLARQVSHVVSVINGSDMVPRFGMSTTRELRETLARVHSEPGLSAEIQRQRKSSQTVEEPSNPEWARKMLGRVESRRPQEEKLFPPGVLLWSGGSPGDNTRGSAAEPTGPSSFAVVDQLEFDSLLLSGSDMFSAHMPQAYARSVLGTCSIGVAAKEKPGLR